MNNRDFFNTFERGDIFVEKTEDDEEEIEVYIFIESHFEESKMEGCINAIGIERRGNFMWHFLGMEASLFLRKI